MTGKEIDGYLVRTAADGSLELRISDAVVRAISMEAMRGFGVTRRRGAEVGGVLLGSARKGVLTVDDCEIVPCEYAYGPSYLLSDNDAPKFAEAAMRWRPGPGVERYAVGWFRSHTRDGLQPDAPDLELFHKHFPSGVAALLLIKPYATRTADAAVFIPEGGRLVIEPAVEFAFAPASAPAAAEPVRPTRTAAPAAVTETAAAPAPAHPPPPPLNQPIVLPRLPTERERLLQHVLGPVDPPSETRPGRITDRELFTNYSSQPERSWLRAVTWTIFLATAVMFGFAAGYRQAGGNLAAFIRWSAPIPAKDPYALGLSARVRGDSILVQWDRYSAVAQQAERATVTVVSATSREEIRLSVTELKSGVLLYKAEIAEADIRMEAFLPGGRSVAQSVVWRRAAAIEQ